MKKLFSVLLALALLCVSACAFAQVKDGTYTVTVPSYSVTEQMTLDVTFEGGKLTALNAVVEGSTAPIFATVKENLYPRMIEAQSVAVDNISGATVSSAAVKSAVSKAVAGTNHKVIKGKFQIIAGFLFLVFILIFIQLFITEDQKLCIGIKNLFQRIVNIFRAAAADDLPTEFRRTLEDQMLFRQFYDLSVIKPGSDGNTAKTLLHVAHNFGPHIGRRIHGTAPFTVKINFLFAL